MCQKYSPCAVVVNNGSWFNDGVECDDGAGDSYIPNDTPIDTSNASTEEKFDLVASPAPTSELANSAEEVAMAGDGDGEGVIIGAAAGAAGGALVVLATAFVVVARRRRTKNRDLAFGVESAASCPAPIVPPPRSTPGSVKSAVSEYEEPVALPAMLPTDQPVYETVDPGDDTYEVPVLPGGFSYVPDETYEMPDADGAAIDYSLANAGAPLYA